MRCVALALAALVCIAAAYNSDFEAWMKKYNKNYSSVEEKMYRYKVFKDNVEKIGIMNSKNSGARFGINAFADRTMEEMRKTHTSRKSFKSFAELKLPHVVAPHAKNDLPTSFNWVDQGAVTGVRDQGNCGSCWAFGAVGTMEGQFFLKKGTLYELSEQNLVDCDHVCQNIPGWGKACDQGCDGGMEVNAFQYVIQNGGINLRADYPYQASVGTCRYDSSKSVGGFNNWIIVSVDDEDDLRQYLYDNGPVSVGVHADEWFYYSGGIFDSSCQTQNDHAVLLTGWGEENGTPYWIIKNSWGTDWGMDGYIHLIRGKNKCGILELMSQVKF
jgi:cathepsin F